jgi:hypothetical protein
MQTQNNGRLALTLVPGKTTVAIELEDGREVLVQIPPTNKRGQKTRVWFTADRALKIYRKENGSND